MCVYFLHQRLGACSVRRCDEERLVCFCGIKNLVRVANQNQIITNNRKLMDWDKSSGGTNIAG